MKPERRSSIVANYNDMANGRDSRQTEQKPDEDMRVARDSTQCVNPLSEVKESTSTPGLLDRRQVQDKRKQLNLRAKKRGKRSTRAITKTVKRIVVQAKKRILPPRRHKAKGRASTSMGIESSKRKEQEAVPQASSTPSTSVPSEGAGRRRKMLAPNESTGPAKQLKVNATEQEGDLEDGSGGEEFEVEAIIGRKPAAQNGRFLYLVKWIGYPYSENTWESEENLAHCPEMVAAYNASKLTSSSAHAEHVVPGSPPKKKLGRPKKDEKGTLPAAIGANAQAGRDPTPKPQGTSTVSPRVTPNKRGRPRKYGVGFSTTTPGPPVTSGTPSESKLPTKGSLSQRRTPTPGATLVAKKKMGRPRKDEMPTGQKQAENQEEKEDEGRDFEVEAILDRRKRSAQHSWEYLVKWVGYPHTENTWQTKEDLKNCPDQLAKFMADLATAPPNGTQAPRVTPAVGEGKKKMGRPRKVMHKAGQLKKVPSVSNESAVKKEGAGRKRGNPRARAMRAEKQGSKEEDEDEDEDEEKEEYEVERLLKVRGVGDSLQYLVKWWGYPESESTWEPVAKVQHMREMIEDLQRGTEKPASKKRNQASGSGRSKAGGVANPPNTLRNRCLSRKGRSL